MFSISKKFRNRIIFLSARTKISDRHFYQLLHLICHRKILRLHAPETFNEKILVAMLHDNCSLKNYLSDKLHLKSYLTQIGLGDHSTPTIAKFKYVSEIKLDQLPDKFVIKTNHDSGSVFIVDSRKKKLFEGYLTALSKKMKIDYYTCFREPNYKNITPKLFIEPILIPAKNDPLYDYKFYCFNGKIAFIHVVLPNHEYGICMTTEWEKADFSYKTKDLDLPPTRPTHFTAMSKAATTLAYKFDFVRIDMYHTVDNFYIGELTFFPNAGMGVFKPKIADKWIGNLWELAPTSAPTHQ